MNWTAESRSQQGLDFFYGIPAAAMKEQVPCLVCGWSTATTGLIITHASYCCEIANCAGAPCNVTHESSGLRATGEISFETAQLAAKVLGELLDWTASIEEVREQVHDLDDSSIRVLACFFCEQTAEYLTHLLLERHNWERW